MPACEVRGQAGAKIVERVVARERAFQLIGEEEFCAGGRAEAWQVREQRIAERVEIGGEERLQICSRLRLQFRQIGIEFFEQQRPAERLRLYRTEAAKLCF